MKTCRTCGRGLPLDQFCRVSAARDGRNSQCRECGAAASRRWYEANRDAHKLKAAAHRAGSPRTPPSLELHTIAFDPAEWAHCKSARPGDPHGYVRDLVRRAMTP